MNFQGFEIEWKDRVESTQDEVKRALQRDASVSIVLAAREQSCGRGRRGNRWESPRGNLYFSLGISETRLLEMGIKLDPLRAIPLICGLATADLASEHVERLVQIKWPNDVMLDNRKLAGTICEKVGMNYIIGVGINVYSAPIQGSTALFYDDKNPLPLRWKNRIDELLRRWLEHFQYWVRAGNVVESVDQVLYQKNEKIVLDGKEVIVLGLDKEGGLKVVCAGRH